MALVTNEKQPYEEVDLVFDFTNRGISSSVTIASVQGVTVTRVSGTGTVTASSTVFSGQYVQSRFAGGDTGDRYKLTAKVVMTDGQRYECDGYLKIKEL
jgi:hypothetical protein